MKKAENLISKLLHKLESPRKLHLEKARETWEEVVSEEIMDFTTIRGFRDGTLKIGVSSQPLLHKLDNFERHQLLENLREAGLSSLEELRFEAV